MATRSAARRTSKSTTSRRAKAAASEVELERPPSGRYKAPPPTIWTDWTVGQVRAAIREHETGNFRSSALLAEWMRRNPRVFTTLENLVQAALGAAPSMRPSKETTNRPLAERLRGRVNAWWWKTIPSSTLASLVRWYILLGFVIAEILWTTAGTPEEPEWRPTGLRVHPPQYVRWDLQKEAFMLTVQEGPDGKAGGEIQITPGDGRWLLFASSEDRPWMNGAVRPLAIITLAQQLTTRDWLRRSEIEGIGIRIAKVLRGADVKLVDAFLKNVARLGDETVLKQPEGYDFDIKAVDSSAAQGFKALIDYLDTAITLVLLGQNLTTQIEGGSFAAATQLAKVQLIRLQAIVWNLANVCRDQILTAWGKFNVANFDQDAAPWPHWDPTPPDDRQKQAQALLTLSQALPNLHAAGIDVVPLIEQYDLRMRDPETDSGPVAFPNATPAPATTPLKEAA